MVYFVDSAVAEWLDPSHLDDPSRIVEVMMSNVVVAALDDAASADAIGVYGQVTPGIERFAMAVGKKIVQLPRPAGSSMTKVTRGITSL